MAKKLDRYVKLKQLVEEKQQQAAEAKGSLNSILERLKKEFDCDSLKEAKQLLSKLKKKESDLAEQFEIAINEFEEKWQDELESCEK